MIRNFVFIALTGSIGSGKSTVASFLSELGAVVIDADNLARDAVKPGTEVNNQIREAFGDSFFDEQDNLNRHKLAEHVFADSERKIKLENIIHPKVSALLKDRLRSIPENTKLVVYVVPLLFEAKLDKSFFDKTVTVSSNKESCLRRVLSRKDMNEALFERIWNSQIPFEEKEKLADLTIKNDSSLEELKSLSLQLFNQLTA